MEKMFSFDPALYAADFTAHGFVHIRGGLTAGFYRNLAVQVEEHLRGELLKQFAIGDKQQAMYEFPDQGYVREFLEGVGGILCLACFTRAAEDRRGRRTVLIQTGG